uniref:Putative ovule protein n=1 Tax=Solanum chacoense TaxID=4108 RepID=A0A0V0GMZ2_SOLCH
MLFLVFTLVGVLPNDYDSDCVKILASPTVPTIDELFSGLLHLTAPPNHKGVSSSTVDSSPLFSHLKP